MLLPPLFLALPLLLPTLDDPPKSAEPEYARMPWHLVDVWWDLGKETPFESLAVDVTISDDVPDSVNLYIAPIGLGRLDKLQFYGGIQTQSDGKTKADPKLRKIGRGLIFSMWGERSLDAVRPADGGLLESSGHEGDFVSVRRSHAWTKGVYTYRLVKMDREFVDGKPHTWVGAFLYNHATNENFHVGALRFPGGKLVLGHKVANFVEIYGRRRPVSEIPAVTITFGPPIVNGETPTNPTATAHYPRGVPDRADVVAKDGSLVVTVGPEVENRPSRNPQLLPPKTP